MRAHDVAACLLFNEPNIRYATGASAMPIYSMSTFVRCAVVPAEGSPILFEHPNSAHLARRIVPQPGAPNFATIAQHTVKQGDRLDLIAAKYLGDPLIFWHTGGVPALFSDSAGITRWP